MEGINFAKGTFIGLVISCLLWFAIYTVVTSSTSTDQTAEPATVEVIATNPPT